MADLTSLLCSPISLADYARICCSGKLPKNAAVALEYAKQNPQLYAILCAMEMVGGLQPLSATRPGVCDPAIHYTRTIILPAATIDDAGNVTPSEARVMSFCAPTNRALVVEKSRVSPGNLTARTQPITMPIYKRVNLGTFGEWCLAFEPGTLEGSFSNVEHIIVPPGGGYSIYVQNWNPNSEAIYEYEARMWAAC